MHHVKLRIVFVGMLLLMGVVWLAMGGCTPMPVPGSQVPPQTRTGTTTATPAATQQAAYEALVALHGDRVTRAVDGRHVSGILSGAVLLHMTITPEGAGATYVIVGSVLPDKFGIGEFDEVDRYVDVFQRTLGHQAARAAH